KSPEGTRICLTADGYVYRKETNSAKIDIFWRNCPSFLDTLNTAVNLNTNKMIERKRVRPQEGKPVEPRKKKMVLKGDVYKFCIENHVNSEEN
ncbi:2801_t:CDS:2, partial [Ambispora leptoticha]